VFGQVPAAAWRRHLRLREEYGKVWTRLLADARRAGMVRADADLTLARLFLLGGLNWTVEWYKPKGRPIANVSRAFASMILDGLLVREAQSKSRVSLAASAKKRRSPS
jgi:hypothetical protein